jgi:hypothetical protein
MRSVGAISLLIDPSYAVRVPAIHRFQATTSVCEKQ